MTEITQGDDVLRQFSLRKLILPILFGFLVVGYFIFKDFDAEKLRSINWNLTSAFWLSMAALAIILRHFFLMMRLRYLSDRDLSWYQSFQLISLWEFSSCVTPSSIGGTAVSLYFLTKEGISVGRTTTIILVTVFLDGLFFTLIIPVAWLLLGSSFLSTDIDIAGTLLDGSAEIGKGGPGGWAYFFFVGYLLNVVSFVVVAYGLFFSPASIKWMIEKLFSLPYIRKWKHIGEKTADDLLIASKELRNKPFSYWWGSMIGTIGGWTFRFLVVNFVILAVIYNSQQLLIFARSIVLYLIMVLSPTPGSSGAAEASFIWIYSDFVQEGIAPALALFWRIFAYYAFIPLGFIVLPQWLRRVYSKDKK